MLFLQDILQEFDACICRQESHNRERRIWSSYGNPGGWSKQREDGTENREPWDGIVSPRALNLQPCF